MIAFPGVKNSSRDNLILWIRPDISITPTDHSGPPYRINAAQIKGILHPNG
jgi:hypothetical protein